MNTTQIGLLLFPQMLQLDFTGPYGVFAAGPNVTVHCVWKDCSPITTSDKLLLTPTVSFDRCPQLDVLCVPGGGGVVALMQDDETLNFIRRQAPAARYISSVCTGALVLGAAGLLDGYKATTHWQSWDMLAEFGAIPTRERVVRDTNLITAAGVSSGIDMALRLAGLLWGDMAAQQIQLNMEYAPEPPYDSGSPFTAPRHIVEAMIEKNRSRQAERLTAVKAAADKLKTQH